MTMIEMVVEGIGIDPHNNPLVLLRDADRKTFLPIWIGPSEAYSIQMELDNRQPQRPMTHDLLDCIFRELGVHLVKVTVNDFADQVYYASLHLQIGHNEDSLQEVDARPSDAIAMALRAHCQILVSEVVAQSAGIQVEETTGAEGEGLGASESHEDAADEIEKFVKLLEDVNLSDETEGKSEQN
ncbi:MAG TPA: bifunctional nuclease family protein [Abditibacteriaceae bacterium]|nr:bifunctional nuclease family protein [Abditibacteriaceae bacterium]